MAMNRPLIAVGWRYLVRHPWQTALMVIGIALGVAVVVAIDLANSSASRAFDLSTEAVAGRATHQVVDGPNGVDEAVYTRLRVEGGITNAAPVISAYVTSPQLGGRLIQLLGIDPFAEAPFRSYMVSGGAGSAGDPVNVSDLLAFLTRPGALLISEKVAQEAGLRVGDVVDLDADGHRTRGVIAGLLRPEDALTRRALDGIVLADIATAQELLDAPGRLSHIDLILPADDPALAARIRGLLPENAQIVPVAARMGAIGQMTAAFRTNLTALSLLALVVGMFLIYNSMTFSVVQRRSLFGTLRCLGATRGEVGRLVLGEAAAAGAIGSLLGIALGVLLGQGAVRLVTQTINDLYFVVTVRGVVIPLESVVKGAGLGMLSTLASAVLPAWEAASVPPRLALSRSGLEEKTRRAVPVITLGGAVSIVIGALILAIPTRSLGISFGGLFLLTVGFALVAPAFTLASMRAVSPAAVRVAGVLGRMAPRTVTGALSRSAVAIAALMVAVSVTIGVGLMVDSFRSTVSSWLNQTLWGDIYISAPQLTAARTSSGLDPRIIDVGRNWPGVASWDALRSTDVSSPDGPIAIAAVTDADLTLPRIFVSTDGGRAAAAEAVSHGAVLASEPLANRLGLPAHGATVTLFTDTGPHTFPVAGIYRDFSNSQGAVMMRWDLYRQHWGEDPFTAVLLNLQLGADSDRLVGELQKALSPLQGVLVRPNSAIRDEALAVFDRAFAITGALQLLAAIVAFIGVLSALLSLQLERGRELGVLRAIGLTVRQMRGLILMETGLMGAVAGLLAIPTGLVLALVLIYIINRRSFGWTMALHADPAVFLQALALAIGAALLAGVYPALRLGRMAAAEALRSE